MIKNVILLFLITSQKVVQSVICYYYPQYPSKILILSTYCYYGCKLNANSADNVCTGSNTSFWWIVFPILAFLVIVSSVAFIFKVKAPKKICSSCPKLKIKNLKLPKFKKTSQSVEQSPNTIELNPVSVISNEPNSHINHRPLIKDEKTQDKKEFIDRVDENDRQNTPPPQYKDLILPEIQDSIYIMPEIEFPMPVIPESINEKNMKK